MSDIYVAFQHNLNFRIPKIFAIQLETLLNINLTVCFHVIEEELWNELGIKRNNGYEVLFERPSNPNLPTFRLTLWGYEDFLLSEEIPQNTKEPLNPKNWNRDKDWTDVYTYYLEEINNNLLNGYVRFTNDTAWWGFNNLCSWSEFNNYFEGRTEDYSVTLKFQEKTFKSLYAIADIAKKLGGNKVYYYSDFGPLAFYSEKYWDVLENRVQSINNDEKLNITRHINESVELRNKNESIYVFQQDVMENGDHFNFGIWYKKYNSHKIK